MEKYSSFYDLLVNYKILPNGMIYSVEKTENDLKNATFYVVNTTEEKSIDYTEGDLGDVPVEIYNDDFIVCELIETQTFKTIIEKKTETNPEINFDGNVEIFINALEFYLDFDTFQEEENSLFKSGKTKKYEQ